jgi:hypothetical protein
MFKLIYWILYTAFFMVFMWWFSHIAIYPEHRQDPDVVVIRLILIISAPIMTTFLFGFLNLMAYWSRKHLTNKQGLPKV